MARDFEEAIKKRAGGELIFDGTFFVGDDVGMELEDDDKRAEAAKAVVDSMPRVVGRGTGRIDLRLDAEDVEVAPAGAYVSIKVRSQSDEAAMDAIEEMRDTMLDVARSELTQEADYWGDLDIPEFTVRT